MKTLSCTHNSKVYLLNVNDLNMLLKKLIWKYWKVTIYALYLLDEIEDLTMKWKLKEDCDWNLK